jgi:phenylacetic acid degradation operon negative regulatory protein
MSQSRKTWLEDRPLTARSVLASTLLGTEPPALGVARLVAVAALFGITENSARVALSRMVAAGELTTDDGVYRLAGHLVERQERQRSSRTPALGPWDGTWHVVVVTAARPDAPARAAARRAFEDQRLAELREGVWTRPANLDVTLPDGVAAAVERWRGSPATTDGSEEAARLWPLDAWARRAAELEERLDALSPALAAGDGQALAPGFVLSASVLRLFQADPLLPAELLPPRWPGARLRRRYDSWDHRYRTVLGRYHRERPGPAR